MNTRTTLAARLQAAAADPMWANHAEVNKGTLALAAQALREHTGQPSELGTLVAALRRTNWSSWQTTAEFTPALEAAERALHEQRCRDRGPELFELLERIASAELTSGTDGPLFALVSEAGDMVYQLRHPQ